MSLRFFYLITESARDDDFAKTVFGQEETVVTESVQHVFDLAIAEDMQQRIVPCFLHLDGVGLGEMGAAESGFGPGGCVEEREHEAAGLQDLVDAFEDGAEQRFGEIVGGVPEDDD